MLLEARGKLSALKHLSGPQDYKGFVLDSTCFIFGFCPQPLWDPNWRTASEIDDDKRELLHKNFPDCQKLLDFIYHDIWSI